MTDSSNSLRADFLGDSNEILGENGNGIKIIVEENSGVADRVEQSGTDTVKIILEKVLKYEASDDATINDPNLNVIDIPEQEEKRALCLSLLLLTQCLIRWHYGGNVKTPGTLVMVIK